MTKFELQQRAKRFHIEVIKLCGSFPRTVAGFETAKQLIRSAGSVGGKLPGSLQGKIHW
ncbi:MAG TPA: four helix bundle protein [Panacibacter sp.]|nr:four helix bundle protein [Panacibacter sp.]HNP46868.1 four helix bundle protein [Panacibacter sp.]